MHPHSLRWRRVVGGVHRWVGIVLSLYVVVICLTGSLIVLRPQIHRWLTQPEIEVRGAPAAGEALNQALHLAYAGYDLEAIRKPRRLNNPFTITLKRDGIVSERLFDPYALRDLGSAYPPVLRGLEWLVDLHDNLLSGRVGRAVNGAGGLLLAGLAVSGLITWWPGRSRWKTALSCGAPRKTRAFSRRLHVSVGFWVSGLVLVWATTAVYFGFPEWFDGVSDSLLASLVRWHFGRFWGNSGRAVWIVLGLVPVTLAVTGLIVWWPRRKVGQTSEIPTARLP